MCSVQCALCSKECVVCCVLYFFSLWSEASGLAAPSDGGSGTRARATDHPSIEVTQIPESLEISLLRDHPSFFS